MYEIEVKLTWKDKKNILAELKRLKFKLRDSYELRESYFSKEGSMKEAKEFQDYFDLCKKEQGVRLEYKTK